MFFSAELLSRRDSGFGLLWLAATLGAKSSLKKLNKRSVMTADIAELCDLIAEPSEPLALRLSSNLMVGVVRVYKVKQEIFMSDVQLCFNSLKKAVNDFHSMDPGNATQLQMAHPSTRMDVLTLSVDPDASFALDFDPFLLEWEHTSTARAEQEDDDDYGVQKKQGKRRAARHARSASEAEQGRGNLHTLPDNPNYLLSDPLNMSLEGSGGLESSSSQLGADRGFGLPDDGLFGSADDFGLGGAMDELARELGWNTDLPQERDPMDVDARESDMNLGEPIGDMFTQEHAPSRALSHLPFSVDEPGNGHFLDRFSPHLALKPIGEVDKQSNEPRPKKVKKNHLVIDLRTELTDDELKAARAHYLEEQISLKEGVARRKAEKAGAEMSESMLRGLPQDVFASTLMNFWKAQLEARRQSKGHPEHFHGNIAQGTKRKSPTQDLGQQPEEPIPDDRKADINFMPPYSGAPVLEDIEQARRVSRPSSVIGSGMSRFGSQVHNSVDWGALDPSSSVGENMGFVLPGEGSERMAVEQADMRLRFRSPNSSRPSSVVGHSHRGSSVVADLGAMPSTQMLAEDFGFALPSAPEIDSQQSDVNLAIIERNSLDYAKMQLRSLPTAGSLSFDEIVPPAICTRHVAASVFYHTLVLATKDLVRVEQGSPHGSINIIRKHETHDAAI